MNRAGIPPASLALQPGLRRQHSRRSPFESVIHIPLRVWAGFPQSPFLESLRVSWVCSWWDTRVTQACPQSWPQEWLVRDPGLKLLTREPSGAQVDSAARWLPRLSSLSFRGDSVSPVVHTQHLAPFLGAFLFLFRNVGWSQVHGGLIPSDATEMNGSRHRNPLGRGGCRQGGCRALGERRTAVQAGGWKLQGYGGGREHAQWEGGREKQRATRLV